MPGPIFRRSLGLLFLFLPFFAHAEVIINEIMYSPVGADDKREWLELYNNGASPVIIKGGTAGTDSWRVYQESTTGTVSNRTFAATAYQGDMTIGSGEYAVIAEDGAIFKNDNPSFAGKILIVGAMSLTNGTLIQKVGLRLGSAGIPWSVISYSSDQGGNDDGNSLQLQGGNTWLAAAPTPGLLNSSTPLFVESTSTATTTEEVATTTAVTTSAGTSNSVTTSASSAHYSSNSLSTKNTEVNIALNAGRDRLGSVGSPLEFKVGTTLNYTRNTIFKWNFGDGSEGSGDTVTHTYEYPGEYAVVLNATLPQGQAVARTNAKIIDPDIAITLATPERIELKNNSKFEVSLYGRAVLAGERSFVFPQDTIIKAGQSISYSSKITGLGPNGVYDTNLLIVGESRSQTDISAKIEKQKSEKIAYIQNKISILQSQMARSAPAIKSGTENTEVPAVAAAPLEKPSNPEATDTQTALALDAVPAAPGKVETWMQGFKRFFLRTK